jgi:preprotein translocase subunit SecE
MNPYLDFGVFKELKDIGYFLQAKVELGMVTWPHEQDVCPDTLYEESKSVSNQVA